MEKVWKLVKKDEMLTVKDLYYRQFGRNGSTISYRVFLRMFILPCNKLEVLPFTLHSPYLIKRKLNFFEKTIDKIKIIWYNKYTKIKKRGN